MSLYLGKLVQSCKLVLSNLSVRIKFFITAIISLKVGGIYET